MTKTKAAVGQVWRDNYKYRPRGKKFTQPTLEVTQTDGKPGGFAEGIRRPSGRKTRVRLDEHGQVRGYTLVTGGGA